MNDTIRHTDTATAANELSLSAPVKKSFSEQRQAMLFGCGDDSLTTPLIKRRGGRSLELTAPSLETNRPIEAVNSFDKRMQLLIASGLICGITPTSIRKQCGVAIPAFVSSWRDGDGADLQKADF